MIPSDQARSHALDVLKSLRRAGHESYWVGGCVRDILMGREPKDFDIATSARPEQVRALFEHTVDIGAAFGVIHVIREGHPVEVATFRADLEYRDGRHPHAVAFRGAEEDARRRDFTINGLFYDPENGEILDFVGGRHDLQARVIRAIGDPRLRFNEDRLRMLRAVRFASTLEFLLDANTRDVIRETADDIVTVSAERIQQELTRMLTESPRAGRAIALLRETGLLPVVLPEVEAMAAQPQPPEFHPEGDVLTHTLMMLDAMEKPSPVLAYAVLLHDVGKPATARLVEQPDGTTRLRFDGHAQEGARIAGEILGRLRLPSKVMDEVAYCVRNHMRFMDVQRMRPATLRRLIGAPTFPAELELHRLDCLCSHGDLSNYHFLKEYAETLAQEPVLPKPLLGGHDIMSLGVPEGPRVGHWHREAYEAQLEERFQTKEELLEWLRGRIAAGE